MLTNVISFLVGTAAHNTHVQQMTRALHEAGALGEYVSAGVDTYRSPILCLGRRAVATGMPHLDRELRRRTVSEVPAARVRSRWRWEIPRIVASRLGAVAAEDWIWERGEHAFDRYCAGLLRNERFTAFMGVEHGALAALKAARDMGKQGVVAFLSPHHRTLAQWVGKEYEDQPDLYADGQARIAAHDGRRNARRDEEMSVADWIISGSSFTTRSLTDAGVAPGKILTIPLGGPSPIPEELLPVRPSRTMRFAYVGPVSVRKGAPYLLNAWKRVARPGVELHLYGKRLVPERLIAEAMAGAGGDCVFVHGSIPASELPAVYLGSSMLILPSLCDGFGQVISDGLACGLPVITTRNAGAADLIEHGKFGFVIPPADENALADALVWCMEHRQEVFSMRRAALAAAGTWTWPHFREQFARVLLAAIDGGANEKPRMHAATA